MVEYRNAFGFENIRAIKIVTQQALMNATSAIKIDGDPVPEVQLNMIRPYKVWIEIFN
jgi:hypothetical protein